MVACKRVDGGAIDEDVGSVNGLQHASPASEDGAVLSAGADRIALVEIAKDVGGIGLRYLPVRIDGPAGGDSGVKSHGLLGAVDTEPPAGGVTGRREEVGPVLNDEP